MTIATARTVAADLASSDQPAVRIAGVSKSFRHRIALSDVDLVVGRGTVHGLLGPNGAGKTTLLRLLFGLAAPDRGQVEVLGRTPYGNPADALAGVAGFVEAPAFYPYLSAQKNLDFLTGLDGGTGAMDVDAALDQVGLGGRGHDKVGGFSTGMKQRLGIAAALLRDPELLILDEPTNGLDPEGMRELHELIGTIAASGRTVLVSSHDMNEVEQLCSDVTVLAQGQVRYSGTLATLREQAPDPTHQLDTADNPVAVQIGETLGLEVATERGGLVVRAGQAELDELVLALGRRGIAVRHLVRQDTALEALFLRLTESRPTGETAG